MSKGAEMPGRVLMKSAVPAALLTVFWVPAAVALRPGSRDPKGEELARAATLPARCCFVVILDAISLGGLVFVGPGLPCSLSLF